MSSSSNALPVSSSGSASTSGNTPLPASRKSSSSRSTGTSLRPIASRSTIEPRDPEAEKALRKKVIQGLPKARRHFDPNRIEISLPADFYPSAAASLQPSRQFTGQISGHVRNPGHLSTNDQFLAPSPTTLLGAGRVDPFAVYPVAITHDIRMVLDQLFTSADPVLLTFRDNWLPVAVHDASTFYQVIASVAGKVGRLRGGPGGDKRQTEIMLGLHSMAMRTVSENLSNPALLLSEFTLAGVAILVCFSTALKDYPSLEAHMKGLERLYQLRGGFESVENNPTLRRILFAVDVAASYTQDCPPRFPFPGLFLQREQAAFLSRALLYDETTTQWRFIFPIGNRLIDTFDQILIALNFARMKIAHQEIWAKHEFSSLWLDPIAYQLFATMSATDLTDHWGKIHEATRLGIILFFGEIRNKTGALSVSTSTQMKKLKDYLLGTGSDIDWSAAPQLLLWIVFFGYFESWQEPEEKWYLALLVKLAEKLGLVSWDGLMDVVRGFLWIEEIHGDRLGILREGFDLKFQSNGTVVAMLANTAWSLDSR